MAIIQELVVYAVVIVLTVSITRCCIDGYKYKKKMDKYETDKTNNSK